MTSQQVPTPSSATIDRKTDRIDKIGGRTDRTDKIDKIDKIDRKTDKSYTHQYSQSSQSSQSSQVSQPWMPKNTAITKTIKQLNRGGIYEIRNPLGRVIAMHERLRSCMGSILDVVREYNNVGEVNELESSLDKLFDRMVLSLEEATSSDDSRDDPQWNDSNTKE